MRKGNGRSRSGLLQESAVVRIKEVATSGRQATDVHYILEYL